MKLIFPCTHESGMIACYKELWHTWLGSLVYTSNGAMLDENLGSFCTRRPSSARKDSSACNREQFSTQFSDPYSKTGSMQLSTMLRDDRGFGRPRKAPNRQLEKKCSTSFLNPLFDTCMTRGRVIPSHTQAIHRFFNWKRCHIINLQTGS